MLEEERNTHMENNMADKEKTTLRIYETEYEALLELEDRFGLSINSLVILACLKYLGFL